MPKKIDPEVKARALRLLADHGGEYPSTTAAAAAIAKQVGVGHETVRRWAVQAQIDDGARPGYHDRGIGRDQASQGREPAVARRCRGPQSGDNFLRGGTRPPQPMIIAFIDSMRAKGVAVESICRVLSEQGCRIAARTYRAWRRRVPAVRTVTDAMTVNAVRDAAWVTDKHGRRRLTPEGLYGREKMRAHLDRTTVPGVSYGAVDRAMKVLCLNGIRRSKGVRTTIPMADGIRAGDLLERRFYAEEPNRVWVTDFT